MPSQVPPQVPVPMQAVRPPTGAPVTAVQVPWVPVALQRSHCPSHREPQQTPSVQKPERHWSLASQVAPFMSSVRHEAEQPSPGVVLRSSHSSPASRTPLPHCAMPPERIWYCHRPGAPPVMLVVVQRFSTSMVREPGSVTKSRVLPASKPACAGVPPRPPTPLEASPVVQAQRL